MKTKRNYPIFKADLVQLSSIATAINARYGKDINNYDVRKMCQRLDFTPVKASEKTHESFVPKLQAYGIYDAIVSQLEKEKDAPAPAPSPCLSSASDAEIFAELRRRGFSGLLKPTAKPVQI